jgi:purine nucleosidase
VAKLAELALMVGGLYTNQDGIDPGAIDSRREFNWWFDPEAARIVLRAPWNKITMTPIDISVKTHFTAEMKATSAKANTPVTQYLEKYSLAGYMWDEIAGAALIDPSMITSQRKLFMDIDIITEPVMARQFSGILRHSFHPTCAWPMSNSISTPRSFTSSLSTS